jgi:hypothetical protein
MPELTVYNPEGSRAMTADLKQNGAYTFDRNMSRNPESVITIFTVNMREQYSTNGKMKLAGRGATERFRKVASLTDPKYFMDDENRDGASAQRKMTADDGQWVAMDWLNPQNIFNLDQNYVVPNTVDDGTNLFSRGLFFVVRPYDAVNGNMDDQPTNEEVKAAEGRLAARYTALVQLYNKTNTSNPKNLPNILSDEMIDALNFADMETPYNTALKQKVTCVNCGERKPAGAKFHRSEGLGCVCIDPSTEGWKAAVNSGIKNRDDVPEEFREKRGPGRPANS